MSCRSNCTSCSIDDGSSIDCDGTRAYDDTRACGDTLACSDDTRAYNGDTRACGGTRACSDDTRGGTRACTRVCSGARSVACSGARRNNGVGGMGQFVDSGDDDRRCVSLGSNRSSSSWR
jgi:hypothetical protein